jgi:tetraprenyl-beta-curcumene synthase
MKVPTNLFSMARLIIHGALPCVHRYLNGWKEKAGKIPDPELRGQALASIETKTFHCEGGAVLALLADDRWKEAIRFIVAYQTISDYLDNLCDRSTSLDPEDFRALHASMGHALTPGAPLENYYRFRNEQDDGGYLSALVKTCQFALERHPAYGKIAPPLHDLAGYYCDLQVHKHVRKEERLPRLQAWFENYRPGLPEMTWYEFAACTGSTLGIFCLVSHGFQKDFSEDLARRLKEAYFPWVQGLHILMDYFVDQEEDRLGGDLNFCSYYDDEKQMEDRFAHFFEQADRGIARLPFPEFHRMIIRGLLAVYLSDRKVDAQKRVRSLAGRMVRRTGGITLFFFLHAWFYRRIFEGTRRPGGGKAGKAMVPAGQKVQVPAAQPPE